eukprot:12024942-Alexandrium_andersonii.AAC.1
MLESAWVCIFEVGEDHGRRTPGQSLNPPDLDAGGPKVLRAASPERMPSPEGLSETALRGQTR